MSEENKEKNLPGVALEAYKDMAQPAARVLGDTLGKCARFALEPVGALADIYRKNLMRFVKKIEKEKRENPENVTQTKLGVAFPILEKMRHTEEEVLADAYAELLKNSCLKDQQAKVLPAYSDKLNQLSSDEVKILDFVFRGENTYGILMRDAANYLSEKEKQRLARTNASPETVLDYPVHGIPFLEVHSKTRKEDGGWVPIAKYFTDIGRKVGLSDPENVEAYIDNLQALGMFEVRNLPLLPVAIYGGLESEVARQYKGMIERENREMELVRGGVALTPLAKSFLAMCTSGKHNRGADASTPQLPKPTWGPDLTAGWG